MGGGLGRRRRALFPGLQSRAAGRRNSIPTATMSSAGFPSSRGLDAEHIHAPWLAPRTRSIARGVTLGKTYPRPIVDHGLARARALAALGALKA